MRYQSVTNYDFKHYQSWEKIIFVFFCLMGNPGLPEPMQAVTIRNQATDDSLVACHLLISGDIFQP